MILAEAVAILNERKHRDTEWYADGQFVYAQDKEVMFTPFEAIAIAEKYQRKTGHTLGDARRDAMDIMAEAERQRREEREQGKDAL